MALLFTFVWHQLQAADSVDIDLAGKGTATLSLKSPSSYRIEGNANGALVIGKLDKAITAVEVEVNFKIKETGWPIVSSLKNAFSLSIPVGSTGTVDWNLFPPPDKILDQPGNETYKPAKGTFKIHAAAFRVYFNGSANDETDDVILVSQSGGSKASPPDGELDVEIKSPVSITVDLAQSNADGKIKHSKSKVSGATLNAKVDLKGLEPSSKKNATVVSGKAHGFEDKNDLTLVKVSLESLSFNYDENHADSDAISIRESYSGNHISAPEWEVGGKNEPAAYIKGSTVKIQPKFKIVPADASAKIKVKAVSANKESVLGDLKETEIDLAATTPSLIELEKKIPDKISKTTEAWDWKLTSFNGKPPINQDIGKSTGHVVYILWGKPKTPWETFINGHPREPWVNALDLIFDKAGVNKNTDVEALAKITKYLHSGHGMIYAQTTAAAGYYVLDKNSMPLSDYINKTNAVVNCYDQAVAVAALGKLLGIDVQFQLMSKFGYINATSLVGIKKQCNNPVCRAAGIAPRAFDIQRVGENDIWPNRSFFTKHCFNLYQGKVYDACQGPYLGSKTPEQYIATSIDNSTPKEIHDAGSIRDMQSFGSIPGDIK